MNSSKNYKIFYYLCFSFTLIAVSLTQSFISYYDVLFGNLNIALGIFNTILVVIFASLTAKRKLSKVQTMFPVLYLLFLIIILATSFLYNLIAVVPYLHFNYFITFVLFNYILLNLYSLLSIPKKRKTKK